MSLAWREGMHSEVKEKVIGMITAWEKVQFKKEYYKYVKYSQFYKICVNKYGSKSAQIKQGFDDQQSFRIKITRQIGEIKWNISNFMFGFTKKSDKERIVLYTQMQRIQSFEEFKQTIDKQIQNFIIQSLEYLQATVYTSEKIISLRQKIEQAQKQVIPADEQSFRINYLKWQELINEAINVNCLQQVLTQIQTTYNNITTFKTNLAQKTITIHGPKVLENLYQYSLTHRQTEYNSQTK